MAELADRTMISDSELRCLGRFVAAHRGSDDSPQNRRWADHCAALLAEWSRLEREVEDLTGLVDAALESRRSDSPDSNTWVI